MKQKLIFTNLVGEAVDTLVADLGNPQTVVIADVNTAQFVLPVLMNDSTTVASSKLITIKAGDTNKNLEELGKVWRELSACEASRNTVIINLGGGVVSDLGGLAAATFKRGLRVINVPTTVLGAVDACYGGKTGINFNGYKNQIGTFTEPVAAVISSIFFNTLPAQQVLSGYAEMLKHGLLENEEVLSHLMRFSPVYPVFDSAALLPLIEESVMVKKRVIDADFTETGLRKILNFGHTIGHAFEKLAYDRSSPVAHGYAVAMGLVAELVLSHMKFGFSSDILHKFADYVLRNYGAFDIDCKDYPALIDAMRQDKKNRDADSINFTLLEAVGIPHTDCVCSESDIIAALDIYRDLMHIA